MDQFVKKLKKKNAEIGSLNRKVTRLEEELKAERDRNVILSNSNKQMIEELERLRIVKDGFIAQTDIISELQKEIRLLNNEIGVLKAFID